MLGIRTGKLVNAFKAHLMQKKEGAGGCQLDVESELCRSAKHNA